jgi:hypothetical protein
MNKLAILLIMICIGHDAFSQGMTITSIREEAKMKRGKTYEINWSGGQPSDAIALELINKKQKVTQLSTTTNNGHVAVRIPSRTRVGKYSLLIKNTTSGEIAQAQMVKIRRRIPLGVQIAMVVVPLAINYVINGPQAEPLPEVPNPQFPD